MHKATLYLIYRTSQQHALLNNDLPNGISARKAAILALVPDFRSYVGPYTRDQLITWLSSDWGINEATWPFSPSAIDAFLASGAKLILSK